MVHCILHYTGKPGHKFVLCIVLEGSSFQAVDGIAFFVGNRSQVNWSLVCEMHLITFLVGRAITSCASGLARYHARLVRRLG